MRDVNPSKFPDKAQTNVKQELVWSCCLHMLPGGRSVHEEESWPCRLRVDLQLISLWGKGGWFKDLIMWYMVFFLSSLSPLHLEIFTTSYGFWILCINALICFYRTMAYVKGNCKVRVNCKVKLYPTCMSGSLKVRVLEYCHCAQQLKTFLQDIQKLSSVSPVIHTGLFMSPHSGVPVQVFSGGWH